MDISTLIASRMNSIDSSGIRKVFDMAGAIEDPINLSIGQPDFDVPEPIKARAMWAIENGENRYTVTQGIQELRDKVLLQEKSMSGIGHDNVLITSGVSGGLLLALLVMVNDGDKVAVPDPYFVMYKHLTRLAGGRPLYIDTYPDFILTAERLEKAGAAEAKILIVNSPNNPTGQVIPPNELENIAEWADANNVFVITDEIYRFFTYDEDYVSIAQYTDNTLLLNGFSKSHAMTGWRLGYAIGPAEIIDEMTKLQQFSFVCAPSIVQQAALSAFEVSMDDYFKAYKAKRDLLVQGLDTHFDFVKPKGAFYAFVRAPGNCGDTFAEKAIQHRCLVIPGSVFSERKTHFRIVFAAEDDTISRGTNLLVSLLE